ncbi:hypothetical protein ACLOJK_012864 [Asimina triloba]
MEPTKSSPKLGFELLDIAPEKPKNGEAQTSKRFQRPNILMGDWCCLQQTLGGYKGSVVRTCCRTPKQSQAHAYMATALIVTSPTGHPLALPSSNVCSKLNRTDGGR